MNENENMSNTPENNGKASPEDTKAFNWNWTDESCSHDSADTQADTDSGTAAGTCASTEEIDPASNDKTDKGRSGENSTSAESAYVPDRSAPARAMMLSQILSAVSILLIMAFSLSLMFGIFPVNGREVVNIGISDLGQTDPDSEASPALLEDFMNSVVVVVGRGSIGTSTGTGVIIGENGYIVTNHHVIEDTTEITVKLYGEDIAVKASIVGFHAGDDVAVLKIDRTGLRTAPFADSDTVRYGEKVYAIGTPEGEEFSWSITQGIVSSPLRQIMIYDDEGILEKKMNVVQTDASVNHGNSGGPLINTRGEIVGIVTLKRSDSAGLGFALPADGVYADVKAILEKGNAINANSGISLPRPLIGITGMTVMADTYYIPNETGANVVTKEEAAAAPTSFYAAVWGVYVSKTTSGFDASKHLQIGDIITEINGVPIMTINELMSAVNKYNGGDRIRVKFYRGGKYYTAEITLMAANSPAE